MRDVKEKLEKSIGDLFKYDHLLLDRMAHERSIAHMLAIYLKKCFPDYDVDCEYNLKGLNIKKLLGKKFYPDILVHKRGVDDDNLLAIELKKFKSSSKDQKRLRILTSQEDNEFKYEFGAHIVFYCEGEIAKHKIEYYQDGNMISSV